MSHEAGCAVVTAAKLGCISSPLQLEHSAVGEEQGEWAKLRAMCLPDKGKLVRVKVVVLAVW
jgi:hypothetical protein